LASGLPRFAKTKRERVERRYALGNKKRNISVSFWIRQLTDDDKK